MERKTQAEVLLNAYSRELERQRLLAGAQGLTITDEGENIHHLHRVPLFIVSADDYHDDDDDDSEEEFHYPGAASTPTARPASIRSASTDYFNNRASSSRSVADLTPQLSQAPNFRVPTHDTPQKVTTPQWTAPSPYQLSAHWERDETVTQCRECQRRFTFMIRRVCTLLIPRFTASDLSTACLSITIFSKIIERSSSPSIVDVAGRYSVIAILPTGPT